MGIQQSTAQLLLLHKGTSWSPDFFSTAAALSPRQSGLLLEKDLDVCVRWMEVGSCCSDYLDLCLKDSRSCPGSPSPHLHKRFVSNSFHCRMQMIPLSYLQFD